MKIKWGTFLVIDDIKTTVYETQSIYTISAIITQYRPQKNKNKHKKKNNKNPHHWLCPSFAEIRWWLNCRLFLSHLVVTWQEKSGVKMHSSNHDKYQGYNASFKSRKT